MFQIMLRSVLCIFLVGLMVTTSHAENTTSSLEEKLVRLQSDVEYLIQSVSKLATLITSLKTEKAARDEQINQDILEVNKKVAAMEKEFGNLTSSQQTGIKYQRQPIKNDNLTFAVVPNSEHKNMTEDIGLNLITIGNGSYFFETWNVKHVSAAEQFCRDHNMQLLSVESKKEHEMLHKYFMDVYSLKHDWLFITSGRKNIVPSDTWIWSGTKAPFTLTEHLVLKTYYNSPIINYSQTADCIATFNKDHDSGVLKYNNIPCDYTLPFICEA